jgi:hypothetical protein
MIIMRFDSIVIIVLTVVVVLRVVRVVRVVRDIIADINLKANITAFSKLFLRFV